jgi:hypothetical protein
MPSKVVNEATRRDWRKLGFFYDKDSQLKEWRLVGSRQGLSRLVDILDRYAANPVNKTLSEHEHLGPYMYLEIGTWSEPVITDHWIAGTLGDLSRLAAIIRKFLDTAGTGDALKVRELFSPASDYELILLVREDGFDPASADTQL